MNEVGSICPDYFCTIDTTIGTAVGLLDPRVSDVSTCMILKITQNIWLVRSTRRRMTDISGRISCTILNGITINEWDAIMTRS